MSRAALPYLGVSLAVHVAVALTLLLLQAPRAETPRKRIVTLRFSPPPAELPRSAPREEAPRGPAQPLDEAAVASGPARLSAPAPSSVQLPPAAPAAAAGEGRLSGLPPARAAPLPPPAPVPPAPEVAAPSPGDVLAQLPAADQAAGEAGAARGFSGTPALEWGDRERRLLRAAPPRFPEVLSRKGQEVDVEAELTVAASGVVSQVSIVRSSGYVEVDRAVEQALRGYLFERSRGGEDHARIRFHFRLEHSE